MEQQTTPATRAVHATLRLGTRASLLARAQSQRVAEQLMAAHPGLTVKLVTLSTRGDRDTSTPLSTVRDKDFFSDDLDAALAAGHVDFCVHSWKDIDGPRPADFVRAAVPTRALPHDAVVFRGDILTRLRTGKTLRIGTSSLRRSVNTADFLAWALPRANTAETAPAVEFLPLRGPVDERLMKISTRNGNPELDGVVLALAGLERLWHDPTGRRKIAPALEDARWMVMPLSECPAAPAQGALAVETLASNTECRAFLAAIHDPETERLVSIEQALVNEFDATVSGAFGATAVSDANLGYVARLRGRVSPDSEAIYATRTAANASTSVTPAQHSTPATTIWNGASWHQYIRKTAHPLPQLPKGAVFIAHADAMQNLPGDAAARYWTSGPRSWARLARQGIWVEGCGDNLGFAALQPLLGAPVLNLPPLHEWTALTHTDAVSGWANSGVGTVLASYTAALTVDPQQAAADVANCSHFYWSSARQYAVLRDYLPPAAHHACGPGKTLTALRAAGLSEVQAFASRKEWQQWVA